MLTDASSDPEIEPGPRLGERLAAWFQPRPGELIGLAVLVLGAVVATIVWWQQAATGPAGTAEVAAAGVAIDAAGQAAGAAPGVTDPAGERPGDTVAEEGAASASMLTVHVSGAVRAPGLVTLPAGARVGDAVLAAGGLADEADPARANLARLLADGEQVHLPASGEEEVIPPPAAAEGTASAPAPGPIDLNTADAATLQTLPGIGPARAAAIIEHRTRHGPFTVAGDLRDVSGIGEQTFQRLAPDIVVR